MTNTTEREYIKIPYTEGELTLQSPAFKGTYGEVAKQIDKAELKRLTSSETASLAYITCKNPNEEYSKKIIQTIKLSWLWEYAGNYFLPRSNSFFRKSLRSRCYGEINNGVIIDLDSQALKFNENGLLIMDKNCLIRRLLDEEDPLVKFVPFGYKTGKQTWQELEKNPYILARYGKEGAEKLAEVASKYKDAPYFYGFDSVDREKIKPSALCWGWCLPYGSLSVDGGSSNHFRYENHVFGKAINKNENNK